MIFYLRFVDNFVGRVPLMVSSIKISENASMHIKNLSWMHHKKGKKTIKQLSDKVVKLTNIIKVLQHELKQLKTKYVSGHDKSMERGPSKKIKCHECNKALENLKAMKRHMQKQHQKRYKCN